MKSQKALFWQTNLNYAATMHEKMAEMQKSVGLHRLASESLKTAQARRIAAANVKDNAAEISETLSYGEWAQKHC